MHLEELIQVHSVTINKLSAHAAMTLMPDHEYTGMTRVIIAAGLETLKISKCGKIDRKYFESSIFQHAKQLWLNRCEAQIQPHENTTIEMGRADSAFDYIYKNGKNPKGWPF